MGVLWIPDSSQDEPNHSFCCFLWQCCALSRGCGEEAQVVFREHERDNLNPADGVRLLRVLVNPRHLLREEEENHLLGRDGTSREGRFLLYWITTTSISTSTSLTTTFSVSSA